MIDFKQLAQQYKSELLDRVMPFWMEKSIDKSLADTLPVWSVMARYLIQTSLFGCRDVKYGCYLLCTTR